MYRFKAHRTMYHEVYFRSRLEARWAAFMDYVHWAWVYEPIDLEGWSPDFAIAIALDSPDVPALFFGEVKPYERAIEFQTHRAFGHIYPRPALFLGASPDACYAEWDDKPRMGIDLLTKLTGLSEQAIRIAWARAGNVVQYLKS